MARSRSRPRNPSSPRNSEATPSDSTTSTTRTTSNTSSNNTNNNNTNERGRKMAGLTPEQIAQLLGASRTKGVYIQRLTEFMNSGEQGVDAKAEWPEFAEKATATLKQGFENAKNSKNAPAGVEHVRVITNEDNVYLINQPPAEAAA